MGFSVRTAFTVIVSALLVVTAAGALVWATGTQSGVGSISGVVYFDKDASGTRGTNEGGLSGVIVQARDAATGGQTFQASTQTLADGSYGFTGLTAGSYTVAILVTTPFTPTTETPVTITVAADPVSGVHFGATIVQTLTGTEFNDVNSDGAKGLNEPGFSGWLVQVFHDANGNGLIDMGEAMLGSDTSDSQGNWKVRNLKPGLRVVVRRPPGGAEATAAPISMQAEEAGGAGHLWNGHAARPAPAAAAPGRSPAYVPGELLVGMRPGTALARVTELFAGVGATIKQPLGGDAYQVTLAPAELDAALDALQAQPEVRYAERNGLASALLTPSDPNYNDPNLVYAPQMINAPAAWDLSTGSQSVIVAIVDTGIALTHPEFTGRLTPGWDYHNNDSDPSDDQGHGTHVAGIAAAAINNQGVVGIAPNVKLMPIKVLDNSSQAQGTWANISLGIRYAADNGAKVVNLSLGGTSYSAALLDAVQYATNRGLVVVGAAGNQGSNITFYPASFVEAIAVGATDEYDEWWSLSNYASWLDVTAPGSSIWGTWWDPAISANSYGWLSGTSMATPHVSGLAALLWSYKPALSAADIRSIIQQTAVDKGTAGFDNYYGWGRINAGAAMTLATSWSPSTPTPTTPPPTATRTPTKTATPTNTPPPTATPTPTWTPTFTPTASQTRTHTPTATGTATWTFTPAPTAMQTATVTRTPTASNTPTASPTVSQYLRRVNAAGTSFTDSLGQVWSPDQAYASGGWGYVSGTAKSSTTAVNGTVDDALYQKYREAMTEYDFTVPNGSYDVILKFAEFGATATGKRVMKITIEGAVVAASLDVYALAGKATAYDKTYIVTVSDGLLNIAFAKVSGTLSPMVSAIQVKTYIPPPPTFTPTATATRTPTVTPTPTITPGGPTLTFTPTATATRTPTATATTSPTPTAAPYLRRVNAGGVSFTDSLSQVWSPDQVYATGGWGYVSGTAKSSKTAVNNTVDDLLYQKYREAMTAYQFTVPNGQYEMTLKFAEFVASSSKPRVMKITIEGVVVENTLNVLTLAGKATAFDRTYTTTVTDGVLNIAFAKNGGSYSPMVSAIEVKSVPPVVPIAMPGPVTPTPTWTPTVTPTPTATPTRQAYFMWVDAGGPTFTDSLGTTWTAEQPFATASWGYVGGTTGSSATAVNGTVDDFLFQKYRQGMTEFKFTVPNGSFQVRLRFAEFTATAAGQRLMQITLEGTPVESALDLYAVAGSATALDRTYTTVVSDGILNIGFAQAGGTLAPVVSAIEVQ